jgi:ElaB/YqjD/DUF883 family membrane-anchored ribosome-binding protein
MKSKSTLSSAQKHLDELQSLVGEAQSLMKNSVSQPSAELLSNLRERFDDAQERFTEAYSSAKKQVVAGAKYTDKTIRANPYQALAITAVVCLGVGFLLGRRSGDSDE